MVVEAVSSDSASQTETWEEQRGELNGRLIVYEKSAEACFIQYISNILTNQPKTCSFLWGYFDPEHRALN